MLKHWIWFAHRPGLPDRVKPALLERFPDAEEIYYAGEEAFEGIEGLTREGWEALRDKNLTEAERILGQCDKKRLHILTYGDAAYPGALKHIADPPMVLYYKGQLPDLDSYPVIGVVGTRKASAYGLTTARRMGYQIAKHGGIVVSGMAYGIDGIAMNGAISAGGTVVGVLGCGADVVYPASNRALFGDTEAFGCIVSEFKPGTPPYGHNFPRRNRIISGLSDGVLVVEAPERSGALITARQAVEQGRDVFVVPGNIDQPSCAGSNLLLRDGAIMASSGWNVIQEYEWIYPDKIHPEQEAPRRNPQRESDVIPITNREKPMVKVAQSALIPGKRENLNKELTKKGIDKGPSTPYSDLNKEPPRLSDSEQTVVDALKDGERLVDDVIAETGLPTGKLLTALTTLELKGILKRLPGKRIMLKKEKP